MIIRGLKYGLIAASGVIVVGGLIFGRDLTSYLRSSARSVQTAVKESVPIDFELQRARDLIEQILPELRANVQVIAQEEVEVAHLQREIEDAEQQLTAHREQVGRLRDQLATHHVSYTVNGRDLSREQVTERLAHSFGRYKQSETILTSKRRLLETRERSLQAAHEMLDRTRARKAQLEQQIEALVAQYRLVKAQAVGTQVHIDNSQLARAEKLMAQIQKRLDTAQRVLAHEADLLLDPVVEVVNESELLAEIDAHLEADFDAIAAAPTDND
jgi:chromosome segregation ATPase